MKSVFNVKKRKRVVDFHLALKLPSVCHYRSTDRWVDVVILLVKKKWLDQADVRQLNCIVCFHTKIQRNRLCLFFCLYC